MPIKPPAAVYGIPTDSKVLRDYTEKLRKETINNKTEVDGNIADLDSRITDVETNWQDYNGPRSFGTPGTVALAPGTAKALFLGYAWKDVVSSFTMRWGCTTGGAGYSITWAEIALATGNPVLGGGATLTPVGFASIQAFIQSAGAPGMTNTTFSLSAGQTVTRGQGLWVVWATLGGLSPTLRSLSADAFGEGVSVTNTVLNWRPSSNIGTALAWTLNTTSAAPRAHLQL